MLNANVNQFKVTFLPQWSCSDFSAYKIVSQHTIKEEIICWIPNGTSATTASGTRKILTGFTTTPQSWEVARCYQWDAVSLCLVSPPHDRLLDPRIRPILSSPLVVMLLSLTQSRFIIPVHFFHFLFLVPFLLTSSREMWPRQAPSWPADIKLAGT